MRVAVTGASGHLGLNLVRSLLERGDEVVALGHASVEPLRALDVEVMRGDVLDPDSLQRAFTGTEIVYHLAGVISLAGDPTGEVRAVNVEGAANAARAASAAGVRRMVHCSSIHAYDLAAAGGLLDERSPRTPDAPSHPAYDRSKAAGEAAVAEAVRRGLDAVVVQPSSVIGPLDPVPSAMGRFFLRLYRRRLPALIDAGFDFVDVRDVAAGLVAAGRDGRRGEAYLLGAHYVRLPDLAALAGRLTGRRPPPVVLPPGPARLGVVPAGLLARLVRSSPLLTGESLRALRHGCRVDHGKAADELGYRVRPLEETIRDVYRWFADAGMLPEPGRP